jgi:thiol-disulfide isomerase/thioredoxin
MHLAQYYQQFEDILSGSYTEAPYHKEAYLEYVKLNRSRMKRWNKTGKILPEHEKAIGEVKAPQHWLLITEPWCGDAANITPFFEKVAGLNPNIKITVQNRDAENSEIEKYLTNGGKSIPKLIIRDKDGNDLAIWGPRPKDAQALFHKLREENANFEEQKVALLTWYNKNKGLQIQEELVEILSSINL